MRPGNFWGVDLSQQLEYAVQLFAGSGARPCADLAGWGRAGSASVGLRCLSSLWQEQRQHFEGLLEDAGEGSCHLRRGALTHGRRSVAAQSWSTAVVTRSRRNFREP